MTGVGLRGRACGGNMINGYFQTEYFCLFMSRTKVYC